MKLAMSFRAFRDVVGTFYNEREQVKSAYTTSYRTESFQESLGLLTWSVVARVQSGLRTLRPAFFRPSKACYALKRTVSKPAHWRVSRRMHCFLGVGASGLRRHKQYYSPER